MTNANFNLTNRKYANIGIVKLNKLINEVRLLYNYLNYGCKKLREKILLK